VDHLDDGVMILTCPYLPAPLARSNAHLLLESAAKYPERILIAEKTETGDWHHLTYAQAVAGCRRVAQWLINHGAGVDNPLAILSGNSIRHFLMAWGAVFAQVPYVPVSIAYSTVTGARPKLEAVLKKIQPSFIFAEDLEAHLPALSAVDFDLDRVTIITAQRNPAVNAESWDAVMTTEATAEVDDSIDRINHDTVTRYMFTSGSTGMPKAVIYTHGMCCAFIASEQGLQENEAEETATRVLEWMPWSHVGGGVMRLTAIIAAGGAIWLDTGRPLPGEFQKTLANLRKARPNTYAGAPFGWSMITDALEADTELAALFFKNMIAMDYGSAAMPQALAQRIDALSARYTGERIPMKTSLLSTEVMTCLRRYWITENLAVVGLPMPGVELKLIPFGSKFELRVRGKGVTPGYYRDPEKTREAFDENGFFKMGDAVVFADPDDPVQGLCFAGRVHEEFKLQTGTWVSAGTLRADVVTATSPYIKDAVICGLNQTYIGILAWPNLSSCAPLAGTEDPEGICASQAVKDAISAGLAVHNANNRGSSRRIERFLLLAEPPDPGAFEIADKGYINQGEVQRRRASEVARLYADPPDAEVVVLSRGSSSQ
jgi:feruloyl-CoA synthase